MNLNFEGLYQLCNQYAVKDDEKSTPNSSSSINFDKVKNVKASDLEQIGKDFLKTYKSKIEQIFKEIRAS